MNGQQRTFHTRDQTDLEQALRTELQEGDYESEAHMLRQLLRNALGVHDVKRMEGNYTEPIELSEMEHRIVGNRLWECAEELYGENEHVNQETQYLARKFHQKANTRKEKNA